MSDTQRGRPTRHQEATMEINRRETAVVFTDPQNEVLSDTGKAWPLVRESLAENNTIDNMDRLFAAAKQHGYEVFISPHYFYPDRRRLEVQRGAGSRRGRGSFLPAPGDTQPRRPGGLGRRLAAALQAVHRRRQDRGRGA